MDDFSLLTFSGRLTDDPELRNSSAGNPICKFTVAVNKRLGKGEERTSFIPVTVFGKQAELCAKYLSKGRGVHVVGELETDKYTDKEGVNRKSFACVVGEQGGRVNFGSGGSKPEAHDEDEETSGPVREKINARIAGDSMRRASEVAQGGKKRFGVDRDRSDDRNQYGRGRRDGR